MSNEKVDRSRVYAGDSEDDDDVPQPPTAAEPAFDDRPHQNDHTAIVERTNDPVEPLGYDYATEAHKWADWKGSLVEDVVHKDEEFYMQPLVVEVCVLGGMVLWFMANGLQVDEQIFNLPRRDLVEQSPVVQAILASGAPGEQLGETEDNPLMLSGMTNDEFNTFLEVPSTSGDQSEEVEMNAWKDVLKVASILQTHDLFATAVAKLDDAPLDPATRAQLANLCEVREWLRPAYEALCSRGEALTLDEGRIIGWGPAFKILKIREIKFQKSLRLCHRMNTTDTICKASQSSDIIFPDKPDDGFQETLDACLIRAFQDILTSDSVATSKEVAAMEDDGGLGPPSSSGSRNSSAFSFIVLKVEDSLFRVPRNTFEDQSSTFQSMYDIPDDDNEDNPVVLHDVTAEEFRSFLKCTIKRRASVSINFILPTPNDVVDESEYDLLTTYRLCAMWGLHRSRRRAFVRLNALVTDVVERMAYAREFSIEEWVYPTLCALALRKECPDESEVNQIGYEYLIPLFRVREEIMPERWRIMQTLMNTTAGGATTTQECIFCNGEYTTFWFRSFTAETEARMVSFEVNKAFADLPGVFSGQDYEDEELARTIATQPTATRRMTTTGNTVNQGRPRAQSFDSFMNSCCRC